MDWAKLLYSRRQVDAAGKYLALPTAEDDPMRWTEAMSIVNNWRASHNFPLNTFQVGLRKNSRSIDPVALVAQRLKRLPSILSKLQRFPDMSLARMQDIGGCRSVLGTVDGVNAVKDAYLKSRFKHVLLREHDYITNPKSSGYRGIHLVYRYNSDRNETYNNHRIELQIRSRLQHSWATAVETVGTLIGQALKSSEGEQEWLAFFALVSSAFALREGTPVLADAPADAELINNIRDTERRLNVTYRLNAFRIAIKESLENPGLQNVRYYLMVLDRVANKIQIRGYSTSQFAAASRDYLDEEKRTASSTNSDVVLVAADSVWALRNAYPNYFGDTQHFLAELKVILGGG